MFDQGVALVAARTAFFAAAMAAFGSALFPFYAVRHDDREGMVRRIRPLLLGASILALVSALAWLAFLIVEFGGVDAAGFAGTANTILFDTGFGSVWLIRLAAALLLVFAAASRLPSAASLALATVLLASQAWLGHSATGSAMHRVIQIAHLLSAGAWLGGLLPLSEALRRIAREKVDGGEAPRMLLRFSAMGMTSVGLIAVTGVLNTWFVIGRVPAISGAYGQILLLKIALFAAMVIVAIFNRLRLLPRVAHAEPRSPVLRRFWRSVVIEQGLGLAVLAAASILGQTSPQDVNP